MGRQGIFHRTLKKEREHITSFQKFPYFAMQLDDFFLLMCDDCVQLLKGSLLKITVFFKTPDAFSEFIHIAAPASFRLELAFVLFPTRFSAAHAATESPWDFAAHGADAHARGLYERQGSVVRPHQYPHKTWL